jgi:drug/metabolite transporter (DMT)-like permease
MIQMLITGILVKLNKESFFGPKETRIQMILQGFCGGLLILSVFVAFQHVPLGNASAIFSCTPVATFIFGKLMLKEPLKGYRLMIIAFMMFGAALMTRPSFLGFPTDSNLQSQLWMLNETTLINKANIWQSTDKWKLKTINQSINIENMSNHTVLGVKDFDTVIEEEFDQYKFEEAWIKGESDNEGFFTLTHMKSKKVLTAISAQILKVMDDTNDNYEILGYIACCLVPIFSAIISIWNSQCTLVHPTAMMFWYAVGSCIWAVVGIIVFNQSVLELLSLKNEIIGYTTAIVLAGMFENYCDTVAVREVSPTKVNVVQCVEVIVNYFLQLYFEHHSFHPSDIFGILLLLIAVNATIFEQKYLKKLFQVINRNLHRWI